MAYGCWFIYQESVEGEEFVVWLRKGTWRLTDVCLSRNRQSETISTWQTETMMGRLCIFPRTLHASMVETGFWVRLLSILDYIWPAQCLLSLGGKLLNNDTIVNIALDLVEACWNTYASTECVGSAPFIILNLTQLPSLRLITGPA